MSVYYVQVIYNQVDSMLWADDSGLLWYETVAAAAMKTVHNHGRLYRYDIVSV